LGDDPLTFQPLIENVLSPSKLLSLCYTIFLLQFFKTKMTTCINLHNYICAMPQSNDTNITTQWQNKLQWQDDRNGSLNFQDMHKQCIKGQPQKIPTTCRRWGTNYGNLKLSTHEDFGKIYALSIRNGDDGILNLNATTAIKNKP
jgi:hypothetical protein